MFNFSGNPQINSLSALELSVIEEPVFAYNKDTKNYNISFIGYSDKYVGPIITTINVVENSGLESVYSITPNLSS